VNGIGGATKHAGSLSEMEQKNFESRSLIEAIDPVDYVVLLDERGKMLTSPRTQN
jgi:23S rRNA pseudoU1915 N3-methylase RlmH